jgi:transposase
MKEDGKIDVHLDGSSMDKISRLEVIEGPTGRRRRSKSDRARIASESMLPGVKVADTARKYGTTRWQIYDWRKQLRKGTLAVPECVAALPAFAEVVVAEPARFDNVRRGGIEIAVDGIVIRVCADADEGHLARVIRAVRAATR